MPAPVDEVGKTGASVSAARAPTATSARASLNILAVRRLAWPWARSAFRLEKIGLSEMLRNTEELDHI